MPSSSSPMKSSKSDVHSFSFECSRDLEWDFRHEKEALEKACVVTKTLRQQSTGKIPLVLPMIMATS